MLLFVQCQANAYGTVQVFYGNTGVSHSVSHGAGPRMSTSNFGSNALFTPTNARLAGERNRYIQRQKAMTRAMERTMANNNMMNPMPRYSNTVSTVQQPQMSRFSKDYRISAPQKTTRGGVTYYN